MSARGLLATVRPPPLPEVLRLLASLPLDEVGAACERGYVWAQGMWWTGGSRYDRTEDTMRWQEFREMLNEIRNVALDQQREIEQREADEAAAEVGT